ncbi:MAG: NigD-like C-terminal domain-containing protein [Rikenellaceae bacterium]
MKKLLFLPAMIIASAIALTSCSDNNKDSYYGVYTYATVFEDDNNEEFGILFETDYGKKIYVEENNTTVNIKNLTVGDRKVVGMKLVEATGDYTYSGSLFDIMAVSMGDCTTIESEEQNDAIADLALTLLNSNYSLGMGYLNLFIGFNTDDFKNAQYYLANNEVVDPTTTKSGYLNLELRVDGSSDEDNNKECFDYVSFNLESFRELLEDKKGIMLRINTVDEDDEIQYVEISSSKIFGDDE